MRNKTNMIGSGTEIDPRRISLVKQDEWMRDRFWSCKNRKKECLLIYCEGCIQYQGRT